MVEVRATSQTEEAWGLCRLAVNGHAGAGPKGRDLVCAAVSVLVETLGSWVLENPEDVVKESRVMLEEGYALIEAAAWKNKLPALTERFGLVEYGLKKLAEQYPEYVTFGNSQGERKDHEG